MFLTIQEKNLKVNEFERSVGANQSPQINPRNSRPFQSSASLVKFQSIKNKTYSWKNLFYLKLLMCIVSPSSLLAILFCLFFLLLTSRQPNMLHYVQQAIVTIIFQLLSFNLSQVI